MEKVLVAKIVEIKNGWAAHGPWWTVHGATKEEAIWRYREAERKYAEILARPEQDEPEK